MFKTTKALKAFIAWAAENHVKRIKVGEIEVEISEMAFIPELNAPKVKKSLKLQPTDTSVVIQTEAPAETEEDPDLYWSTN